KEAGLRRLRFRSGSPLLVAREPVFRELLPRRVRGDERVELRPDARVAVQRPEPDPDLVALGPLVAEEARAADRAERLHAPLARPVDADQLLALDQAKAFARDATLGPAEGAGVLATPRAVTVAGPEERRGDLELHAAAEARAPQRVVGARLRPRLSQRAP